MRTSSSEQFGNTAPSTSRSSAKMCEGLPREGEPTPRLGSDKIGKIKKGGAEGRTSQEEW
ncbi:unnamed protein product [Prunus armeniaca]|uniref:Uncharacterized protein n=1 Tax=Prunus armeniaca TaxID=36596 RepID=A0A6J5Y4H9_PRUAR|nr:unnamed protein product [Prunus armeniaca]